MDQNSNPGYKALKNMEEIRAYPMEEYTKDFNAEINTLIEAIERLNLSADSKLQTDKKMIWNILQSISTTRGFIEVITELNNGQKKTIRDFVQENSTIRS